VRGALGQRTPTRGVEGEVVDGSGGSAVTMCSVANPVSLAFRRTDTQHRRHGGSEDAPGTKRGHQASQIDDAPAPIGRRQVKP